MSRNKTPSFASVLEDCGFEELAVCAAESQKPTLGYVLNIMRNVESASKEADALVTWLSRNRRRLGLQDKLFSKDDNGREDRTSDVAPIGKARWQAFYEAVRENYDADFSVPGTLVDDSQPKAETLERGLAIVSAALGFDELDSALFGVMVRYRSDQAFDRLFDSLASARGRFGMLRRYPDVFSLFTGVPTMQINSRFRADAQLLLSGAISIDDDGDICIAPRLRSLVEQCAEGNFDVRTELLGKPLEAKLPFFSIQAPRQGARYRFCHFAADFAFS